MTANTTMPAVVDALVALAQTACSTAQVSDGYPGTDEGPDIVAVGGSVSPTEDGTQVPAQLGQHTVEEDYRVECIISSYRGGTDQKGARDAAFANYNAFVNAIRADWTLGSLVYWAYVDSVRLEQTNDSNAQQGRVAEIHFTVRCMARI